MGKSYDGIKVISVGNLVMGGTGKTPMTMMIAKEYIKRGEKVAVISLGYKGKLGYGTNVISDGDGNVFYAPPLACDEAYMIACNYPEIVVITGKDREASILKARDEYGVTLAILDDAYQYRKVKRDANILLMTQKSPISTGFVFPFGYLREPPSAIDRSDIIIFTKAKDDIIPSRVKPYIKNQPIFFCRAVYDKVSINDDETDLSNFANLPVGAYAATASNNEFLKTLEKADLDVRFFARFSDHKTLSHSVIERIIHQSKSNGAIMLFTTEKDYVKLPENYRHLFAYIRMDMKIENKLLFFDSIDQFINQK